jgi:DHA2 family multidrug resistance protein
MALFMMGNVVAPVVGPIFGAWLTESLSWRWCFFINLPGGICSLLLLSTYLPRETSRARPFDFLGFGSLALGIASLQLMLDRGPSLDWFDSREICTEAALAAGGLWIFFAHTLTAKRTLFDARLAHDRNFVSTTVLSFFLNMPLYASLTLMPLMMQGLMGYSTMISGLVSVPRGTLMLLTLTVIGRLDAIVDRRLLVAAGLFFCLIGFWHMTGFNLSMGSQTIVWAGILQGIGQGIVFVPLATLAFATVDPALRAEATAIGNLVRNLAGSLGVATMQALTTVNTQAMHAALAAHITPNTPALRDLPAALSMHSAKGAMALNAEVTRQAAMVAYVDDFWLMAILVSMCIPLLLLLRKPQPGAAVRAANGTAPSPPVTVDIVH